MNHHSNSSPEVLLAQEIKREISLAGLREFSAKFTAFRVTLDTHFENAIVPRHQVQPPMRNPCVIGLVHERAQSILQAIARNEPLPPIEVVIAENMRPPYRYRVRDGFHRYHLSIALGFSHLPVVIKPDLNLDAI